jgi:hypothetical protein
MGKLTDIFTQQAYPRVNDRGYQSLINKVHRHIFKGKSIGSKVVEDLLQDHSWVPIWVCSVAVSPASSRL